jgi:hypothetical protein
MILKLNEMTPKERDDYMADYQRLLDQAEVQKPKKSYDKYGLRFTWEYLNKIGKDVVFLPIELMCEYVDIITKNAIDSNDLAFIREQVLDADFDAEKSYDYLNATSIGNIAYIAQHCSDNNAKIKAESFLNAVFEKSKNRILEILT